MKYTFTDKAHANRFINAFKMNKTSIRQNSNRYIAAVFLLTSHPVLWLKVKGAVFSTKIDFGLISLGTVDTNAYALYKLAKDIYFMKPNIFLYDYAEHRLLHASTIENLFTAININNCGLTLVMPPEERKEKKKRPYHKRKTDITGGNQHE